jgi:hypothetical protein
VRTVAYYKGCLASLSAKELDVGAEVGLELVELESVTCCGAGDPWKFPRDADALIDYLERWEGSRLRLPARPRASPHALSAPQPESASWGEEGQAKRQVLFGER